MIAALAPAFAPFDAQHIELAFDIAEDEIGSVVRAYSITSSARASSVGGTSRPSAVAVLMLITSSYLVSACTMPRHSLHCSQGFHETAIVQPNNADAKIVQVDGHPQGDRKNGPVNGVEQRKPTAHTTIAEAQQANADCGRPQKRHHERKGQMSSRHSEVRRMQIDDL